MKVWLGEIVLTKEIDRIVNIDAGERIERSDNIVNIDRVDQMVCQKNYYYKKSIPSTCCAGMLLSMGKGRSPSQ